MQSISRMQSFSCWECKLEVVIPYFSIAANASVWERFIVRKLSCPCSPWFEHPFNEAWSVENFNSCKCSRLVFSFVFTVYLLQVTRHVKTVVLFCLDGRLDRSLMGYSQHIKAILNQNYKPEISTLFHLDHLSLLPSSTLYPPTRLHKWRSRQSAVARNGVVGSRQKWRSWQ